MNKLWILAKVISKRDKISLFQLIKALTLFILVIFNSLSFAQCPTCPSPPACSGGNGILSNNTSINAGQTFWYNTTGTLGNINFNGGTLIVCDNLTISSGNFNGAYTIHIIPGATLTINTTLTLQGGANVYNSGNLIANGVTLQNASNNLINCSTTSNLTVSGNLTNNSSTSSVTNHGQANINNMTLQAGCNNCCQLCLGIGSGISLNNLTNNNANTICAPSGSSCILYAVNASLNGNLSSTSNVNVCANTGATTSGAANFGAATVSTNCSSCSQALPIELIDFTAVSINNDYIKLDWKTASETNNDYFTIEKSKNGYEFRELIRIDGAGNSSTLLRYSTFDNNPYFGVSYYRLKQTDFDGKFEYSKIRSVNNTTENNVNIFPNPVLNEMIVDFTTKIDYSTLELTITDVKGNVIGNEHFYHDNSIIINVEKLVAGPYFIRIRSTEFDFVEKFFKL